MNFENRYGLLDRALHRVAFATYSAQAAVADLEDKLFRKELAEVTVDRPVLVTALPRAGTTILLEILAGTPTFAAHTYRDMPFLGCPMLWHRISRPFRKSDEKRERAHQDGIEISLDSPEAFEEVVWKAFWRKRYRGPTIAPWESCDRAEFVEFLHGHLRRIVALRRREKPTACRYVSKNNLNVARIPALWQALPSAIVVVPFREPVQHAASLLNQHRRFTALHREDAFARRYMVAIGHFDFGANLKPVDFDGWYDAAAVHDPERLGFWLAYWTATYRHLLQHAGHERLCFVGFEALGAGPDLAPLAERLEVDAQELRARAGVLKPARTHDVATDDLDADRLAEAREVHAELLRIAVL